MEGTISDENGRL